MSLTVFSCRIDARVYWWSIGFLEVLSRSEGFSSLARGGLLVVANLSLVGNEPPVLGAPGPRRDGAPGMPRAVARLLAMDEDNSRAYRR